MLLRALLNLCWKLVNYSTCKCFTCGIYDLSWYRGLVLSKIPRHTSPCWELIRIWAPSWLAENCLKLSQGCQGDLADCTNLLMPSLSLQRRNVLWVICHDIQLGLGRWLETTKTTTDTQNFMNFSKFKHLPSESHQIHLHCLSFALCLLTVHFLILPIILLWKPCVFPKKWGRTGSIAVLVAPMPCAVSQVLCALECTPAQVTLFSQAFLFQPHVRQICWRAQQENW